MSDEPKSALSEDNLFTAARRVMQSVRVDDERDGGMLSRNTLKANEALARHIRDFEKAIKEIEKNGGTATITVSWEAAKSND